MRRILAAPRACQREGGGQGTDRRWVYCRWALRRSGHSPPWWTGAPSGAGAKRAPVSASRPEAELRPEVGLIFLAPLGSLRGPGSSLLLTAGARVTGPAEAGGRSTLVLVTSLRVRHVRAPPLPLPVPAPPPPPAGPLHQPEVHPPAPAPARAGACGPCAPLRGGGWGGDEPGFQASLGLRG